MGQQIEALAAFAAATQWDDIPGAVRKRAKLALLDTMGVILAGSVRPEVRALRSGMAGTGGTGATLFAPGFAATDPRTAALLNAIAGRSVELCDGLRGVQPSVQLIPGLLALGEQRRCSGKEILSAFLAGYEVAGRLAYGFTPRAYAHPNGQLGVLACAAAGARLRGFDASGVSRSIRIATAMLMNPSYNHTVVGATALNLPAGQSAVATMLAPELALAGYEVLDDAVEEALGNMVGAGFDPAKILVGMGSGWQVSESYFRFYACCNPIHPALDCLYDALSALNATAESIDRIDFQTYAFASVMRNPDPPNYFASKYSLPHAAAVLAVRGGLGFAELDDSSIADPAVAALRHRVQVSEDVAMTARVPAERPARVTVTLKDGRSATAARPMSRRDAERPDPEQDIRTKFRELARTVLTEASVDAVEQAIDRAEDWVSVADLTGALRQAA